MLTIFKVYSLDYFQVCLRHLLHAQRGIEQNTLAQAERDVRAARLERYVIRAPSLRLRAKH